MEVVFLRGAEADLLAAWMRYEEAGTLLFTSEKPAVGAVRPNGTVEIRQIAIHRDLGSTLEISQGLSRSDQVITSPPPGLVDGTAVIIAKPTADPLLHQRNSMDNGVSHSITL